MSLPTIYFKQSLELKVPECFQMNKVGFCLQPSHPTSAEVEARHRRGAGRDGQPLPAKLLLSHLVGRDHSSSLLSDQVPQDPQDLLKL